MASRYWIGGDGNWTDTAHWSTSSGGAGGASAPTLSDDVFFDDNSDSGADFQVSTPASSTCRCRHFDASGLSTYNMTLFTYKGFIGSAPVYIYGNIIVSSRLFFLGTNYLGTTLAFIYLSGTTTLDVTGSGDVNFILFIDGSVTLGADLEIPGFQISSGGAFDSDGYDVDLSGAGFTSGFSVSSSAGAVSFAGSTIETPVFSCSDIDADFSGSTVITPKISIANSDLNNLTIQTGAGGVDMISDDITVSGSLVFELIDSTNKYITWANAKTISVNGDITRSPSTGEIVLENYTNSDQLTLSKAYQFVALDYMNINDVAATGGADFYAGANSVDGGNNDGWLFESPDYPQVAVAPNKEYLYKYYSGGVFKGVVRGVNSEFSIAKQIGATGSQLKFEVGKSFRDSGATATDEYLTDDEGEYIVDENLEKIIVSRDLSFDGMPYLGDGIDVVEISSAYPSGKTVFSGKVTRYSSNYKSNTVQFTAISYGIELANYMLLITDGSAAASYTSQDTYETLYSNSSKTALNRTVKVAQTFQVSSDTDVESITIYGYNPGSFSVPTRLTLYEGTPGSGSFVALTERYISPGDPGEITYTFSSEQSITAGTTYYLEVWNLLISSSGTNTVLVAYDSTSSSYTDGAMYIYNDSSGWGSAANDMYFKVNSQASSIDNSFTDTDISDIVTTILDNAADQGSRVSYTAESIATTGVTLTYTFNFMTILDALKKCMEFIPDFYFYVDPATNILYLQEESDVAEHNFVLGSHILDLDINASIEGITNVVYFTGGDDGTGSNIVVSSVNESSLADYGQWLSLPTDNRATTTTQVTALAEAYISDNSEPKYPIRATIDSHKYDVTIVNPGDVVGFKNINSLIGSLRLQIATIYYDAHKAVLDLDIVPKTQIGYVEDLRRKLLLSDTKDNPDTI